MRGVVYLRLEGAVEMEEGLREGAETHVLAEAVPALHACK